jgi:hypothetical protein
MEEEFKIINNDLLIEVNQSSNFKRKKTHQINIQSDPDANLSKEIYKRYKRNTSDKSLDNNKMSLKSIFIKNFKKTFQSNNDSDFSSIERYDKPLKRSQKKVLPTNKIIKKPSEPFRPTPNFNYCFYDYFHNIYKKAN